MLGPIGASLMSIMRVLTPAEIELYIQRSSDTKVVAPIAVGAEGESSDYIDDPPKEIDIKYNQQQAQDNEETCEVIELYPDNFERVEQEVVYDGDNYQSDDLRHKELSQNSSELESIGIYSAATIAEKEKERAEEKKKATPSASVFLINERLKLKNSQQKLKEQIAIKNYNKNNVIQLKAKDSTYELDDTSEEEISKNSITGILINKKQG